MVIPAFLYPLVFYSEESLLLPLWYVNACNILELYDYGILETKFIGLRNSSLCFTQILLPSPLGGVLWWAYVLEHSYNFCIFWYHL